MIPKIAFTVCILLYSLQAVVCDLTLTAAPATPSIKEDVATGTSVAQVTATGSSDVGPSYTYSLESQTPASPVAFALDGSTGVLSTLATASFDNTANPTHTVVVKAVDGSAVSGTVTITITITAAAAVVPSANSPPTFSSATYTACVAKNATGGTTITTITATDADAGDTITYSITAGNTGDVFEAVSGAIKLKTGQTLPATPTSYTLTYQASSGTPAQTDSATVTVNVQATCSTNQGPGGGNSSGRASGDIFMCIWMFGTIVMALMSLF